MSSSASRRLETLRKVLIGVVVTVVGGLILAGILNLLSGRHKGPLPTSSGSPTDGISSGPLESKTSLSPMPPPSPTRPREVQITLEPLSSSDLEVGKSYKTSGTLIPALPNASVEIQANDAVLTEVVVNSQGEFDASFVFPEPGRQVELTAHLAAGPGNPNATVTAGKYDVFGWINLSSLKPLSSSGNFAFDRQQDLKGQQYDHSLVFYWGAGGFGGLSRGDVTYNLAAKCTKVTALVGPDDNSTGDKAKWSFTFSAGGRSATSGYVEVFKPKWMELNLTGAPRLKIEASRKKGPNDYYDWKPYKGDGVVADPRLLCLP